MPIGNKNNLLKYDCVIREIKSLKKRLKKLEKYFERKNLSFSTVLISPKKETREYKFIIEYLDEVIIGRSDNKDKKVATKEALADALQKVPEKYFNDSEKIETKKSIRKQQIITRKEKNSFFRSLQGISVYQPITEARYATN